MIDTHAHLLSFKDVDDIVSSMENDELEYIVNIGTTVKDSKKGIRLAEKYERVYTTVGIYPEFSLDVKEDDLKTIEEIAKHEKVVAIGEIGLDYHRPEHDKKSQRELFIRQLEIADRLGLPFCIHCRNAADDVYEILLEHKHLINHGGLMHCYSEGKDYIQKFLSLGLHISFSGAITFKKNDRSYLKDIPLDKILVETDAPYLSPEPFRGKENRPERVRVTAKRIADELKIDYREFEKQVSKNAKEFYFKIKNI